MLTQDELIALAKTTAGAHGLDPALVCAVCEQESAWNVWAIRYEDGFYARYVMPQMALWKINATEARARAFSWGLLQIMGEVARERGFIGDSLSSLCDPATGLEYGCRHLSNRLAAAGGDVTQGLLLWNGGANPQYPAQVLMRMPKYQPAMVVDPEIGT
jgi:soluble lytic murein transglycosylase-like protein